MSKPKSVYLTDRSMSALRPGESLSARMNQIVDRYLQLMATYQHALRDEFDDEEWQRLCAAYRKSTAEGRSIVDVCDAMIAVLDPNPVGMRDAVAGLLDGASIAELAGLYDLIEAEPLAASSTGESEARS